MNSPCDEEMEMHFIGPCPGCTRYVLLHTIDALDGARWLLHSMYTNVQPCAQDNRSPCPPTHASSQLSITRAPFVDNIGCPTACVGAVQCHAAISSWLAPDPRGRGVHGSYFLAMPSSRLCQRASIDDNNPLARAVSVTPPGRGKKCKNDVVRWHWFP